MRPNRVSTSHGAFERRLALSLAGTAERRGYERDRILESIPRIDFSLFAGVLHQQGLLPILGARLVALAPDALPREFERHVEASTRASRFRATLLEEVALRLLSAVEGSGIEALPLKGPLLSERLYGDPALRSSFDVDLLVRRQDLERAAAVVVGQGWKLRETAGLYKGLPYLHHTLAAPQSWLPTAEVHWRLHWHETSFSEGLLERTAPGASGRGALAPADEIATLLLFFARDGFAGLRYAVDIGAAWDLWGATLEPGALDAMFMAHPGLRSSLTTAAAVTERLVGVPAYRLLGLHWLRDERSRRAERLADWARTAERDQLATNVTLVDLLLTPRGEHRAFMARHVLPPADALSRSRPLPREALLRRGWLRATHAGKLVLRYLYALWRIRGGRDWAPST